MNISDAKVLFSQSIGEGSSFRKNNEPQIDSAKKFIDKLLREENPSGELSPSVENNQLPAENQKNLHSYLENIDHIVFSENINGEISSHDFPLMEKNATGSSLEESIVYMLKWFASGGLSYEAKNVYIANATSYGETVSSVRQAAYSDTLTLLKNNSYFGTDKSANLTGNIYGYETKKNSHFAEEDGKNKINNAGMALLMEQVSPYLKRRLMISHKDGGIHIVIRDYFLNGQGDLQELSSLLRSAKEKFSGVVTLTINGNDYSKFMNSMAKGGLYGR